MQQSVLVQTLIVRRGQVLLGRWRSGAFKGRLTGVLGQATAPPGGKLPSPEAAAVGICRQLLGPGVQVDPRRLRRRGFFTFEERDATSGVAQELGERYSEHQLVLRLGPEEANGGPDTFEPVATETFEPMGWFGQDDMPFHMMPQDDEVWYDDVLFGDKRVRGTFAFKGEELVEHSLEEVHPSEGLCGLGAGGGGGGLSSSSTGDDEALLLYNPDCSKSRALREALVARGIKFAERRYLEDPLTLSELETLLARLQAGARCGKLGADSLCRDAELVSGIRLSQIMSGGFFGGGAGEEAGRGTEDRLLEALALRPDLLQRPALVVGRRAALGRPSPEDALRLLDDE